MDGEPRGLNGMRGVVKHCRIIVAIEEVVGESGKGGGPEGIERGEVEVVTRRKEKKGGEWERAAREGGLVKEGGVNKTWGRKGVVIGGGGRRLLGGVGARTTGKVEEVRARGKLVEGVATVAGVAAGVVLMVGIGVVLMGNAKGQTGRGMRTVEEDREGLAKVWREM